MGAKTQRKVIRKLRHWKQRFDKNAEFICRRPMNWDGKDYEPGAPIPEGLKENLTKVRLFWNAHWIELAEFEAPDVTTGQVDDTSWLDDADPVDDDSWLE